MEANKNMTQKALTEPLQKTEQAIKQVKTAEKQINQLTKPTPKIPTQQKPIPQEILILTRGIEEIESILYGVRNQILQLYGPVDYSNISDIELRFTEQQASKLSFQLVGENWIIRPKQYLGEQMFGDIAATVRNLGGEYISAGKDSHFRVKRK